MKFTQEQYTLADEPMKPFIDVKEIEGFLQLKPQDIEQVREVIAKSLAKNRLSLSETALLLNANQPEMIEEIQKGARELKKRIYGNRIVLFAPLYVGSKCANNCTYCGFRVTNKQAVRKTLSNEEIVKEIEALQDNGQKRLILVYGEHPEYTPEFIANSVRIAYDVKKGNGEIRRININAAPLDIEGFKTVKKANIGTYQVFQETYHPEAYKLYHLGGKKSNYDYRLTSLDRAMEAGIDDVGIGALFGLYDWKFEVLGLLRHVNHLEACYNVGPHTISFPRIKEAASSLVGDKYFMSDADFARMIAILRLSVPYTGMILTAREPVELRNELLQYGVSQIDGGTKLELGSYSTNGIEPQDLNKEQFRVNDNRSLGEIVDELLDQDMLPSFCTSCYRMGRTGQHFMEFSVPGFIKKFCTPNAILTLAEYLHDYGKPHQLKKGWEVINRNLSELDPKMQEKMHDRLNRIANGERDLYF